MKRLFLPLAVVTAALVVFFTLGPIADRPQLGHPWAERFVGFLVLGACWTGAFPARAALVLSGLVLAAAGLELGQALAPGRDPAVADALVKALGALAGVVAARLVRLGEWKD